MSGSSPILVVGASGQVARALAARGPVAGHPIISMGRATLDATESDALRRRIEELRPVALINAAAYTAVDKAETDRDAAFALNGELPGRLAECAADLGVPLLHISTDYVFAGNADRPYRPDDAIAPLGVYGESKADGERRVRSRTPRHLIIRTAWVWDETGQNFVRTMLRLGRDREELRVVADQRGAPTYASALADGLRAMAARAIADPAGTPWGTYHLTNAGETTWHGFAAEIFRLASSHGLKTPARVVPITTAEYPTPARRPAYSVLDCSATHVAFGIRLPFWQESLAAAFPTIAAQYR